MIRVKCNDSQVTVYNLKRARIGRRFIKGIGISGERIVIPMTSVVGVLSDQNTGKVTL